MALKVDTIQNPSSVVVNLTLDTSGNVTVGNNLTTTGSTSIANLTYTGTLTGSTGIMNIGSGQLYKDASGNVGIGTSSPSKKVEVYAASNSLQIESIVRNDQAGSGVAAIGFNVSSGAASETTSTKAGIGLVRTNAYGVGSLCFYNNSTTSAGDFTTADERMRIDSSGNVGIGTSAPGYTLDVVGSLVRYAATSSSGYALLQLGRSATATQNWHFGSEGDGTFNWYNGNYGAGTKRVTIDSSGNVQVGGTTVGNTTGYVNSRTNSRAWVNFNGTSASPITPRANYNVSSVTKNATGDYTLNFTTSLADANYAWSYGGTNNINDTATNNVIAVITTTAYQTAASLRIVTKYVGGGGNVANADFSIVCITIFGN